MSKYRRHGANQELFTTPPVSIAIALLVATVIVNPFREMCTLDDSWAYARMVQRLLTTGHYRLDPWAAANMPVQIYLAAALSKVFGYSLSLLRCSTLLLFSVALVSFYRLLRELGHFRTVASILTFAIPASPLILMLAFTFMSDVQFLGWLLLALLLYFQGIRDRSATRIFLGSLAAACAIGTRQFGIAIIGGVVIAWLWPARDRPPVRLLLLGIVLPLFVAAAQIHAALAAPNITQSLRIAETHRFYGLPVRTIVTESIWRCAVISQYVGMAFLPLAPLVFSIRRGSWSRPVFRVPLWLVGLLACAAILRGLVIASHLTARPQAWNRGLATPLQMYWILPMNLWRFPHLMRFLDIGGIVGGTLLIALCFKALQDAKPSLRLPSEKMFLAGTGIGLVLLHLAYRQLNDTYITALIPFGLLLFGEFIKGVDLSRSLIRVCTCVLLIFILATAFWMSSEYALRQALWNSADDVLRKGVPPTDIWAVSVNWEDYHGAFDAWVAAGAPGYDDWQHYIDPLHDPYRVWLQTQRDRAPYRVMESANLIAPPGWNLVASRRYRTTGFSRRFVLTLNRDTLARTGP